MKRELEVLRQRVEYRYKAERQRIDDELRRDLDAIDAIEERLQSVKSTILRDELSHDALRLNITVRGAILNMRREFTLRDIIDEIDKNNSAMGAVLRERPRLVSSALFRLSKQKRILEVTPRVGRTAATYRVA